MAACFYVTIRCVKNGVYLLPGKEAGFKRFKKINLVAGIVSTLVWATLMFISDVREAGDLDVSKSIMSILVGSIVFFLGTTWFQWYMIKRSNKNSDKELDE